MAAHANTLRYWLDVDALTYPDIPSPRKRRHYTLRYSDPLPWQKTGQPLVQDHKYFVYFALVQKQVLETELFELFRTSAQPDPGGNHQRKRTGKTFLCAMEVGADGRPAIATLQLAAFSAAFASKKFGRPVSAPLVLQALKEKIANVQSDTGSGVADGAWFQQVIEFLVGELAWQPRELMATEQICIHRVPLVSAKGKPLRKPPEMDPINSFYVDDLQRISDGMAGSGACASQVQAYLDGAGGGQDRIDVTQPPVVDALLRADHFPPGRWPSKFPLFLMQQVAVNTALRTLADGGIFSVNGPPGTGKTTLLMDVIAARIVQRAEVLARYDVPEQAFGKSPVTITYPPNKGGKIYTGPSYFLDEALLDAGIVVASANNKAVENITRDLPNMDKVWPQPLQLDGQDFDYFAATAQAVLGGKTSRGDNGDEPAPDDDEAAPAGGDDDGLRCWGLISAPLGKKSNRGHVADQLGVFADNGIENMLDQLPTERLDWSRARARFADAIARVTAIQERVAAFDAALPACQSARQALAVARAALETAAGQRGQCQAALEQLDADAARLDSDLQVNLSERNQLARDWPWWRLLLAYLFNRGAHAEAGRQRAELASDYLQLRATRAANKRTQSERQAELATLQRAEQDAAALAARLEREAAALEAQLARLRAELGPAAFDPAEFAALPADQQQKALPRTNDALQRARAEVFIAGLALHQAFIKAAGKPFATSFRLALAMLSGEAHVQQHLPLIARHLWATFFLVVPVVSSTFASVARCFRDLGEGEIGLLLIDEAGQAVPSHALGAIWRARRALVVGDPLQVEPVINMDRKLDYEILKFHQASEAHQLTSYSAQHLADRANRYGAQVRQYDGSELWVGSPLRVHRRCVDPMFSVSNAIAYNNKMVFGPDPRDEEQASLARPLLGPSRWIDVTAGEFEEHFNPEEGRKALDIVIAYAQQGWCDAKDELPELYLISPFKSVAEEMQALLREHVERWADGVEDETVDDWLKSHVGTVHTFQGKESESVVFILGGKTPGARSWAATTPNIVNVAVTRAKRRLYVIGNRQAWSDTTFGARLAQAVPG
ncbi:DEAD/DEAH box helicase [Duganella callida]|uniref:DNA2/NAM7 helicase-like C-terminal domain-containing protein n=1 Tax=Duganella callida TaxID=2561932 RepID=A0A4Y9S3R4_9BURK|nr:AAA domain-containing protein [Duganella callida]TFW15998.1 hypothetical protein E4L98_25225 [Duganella callida]